MLVRNTLHNLHRAFFAFKRYGVGFFALCARRGWLYNRNFCDAHFLKKSLRAMSALENIICSSHPFIDLCYQPLGWRGPLFQRHQHISVEASRMGGLALTGSLMHIDGVRFWEKISQNLYLVNTENFKLRDMLIASAQKSRTPTLVRIQSTDLFTSIDDIRQLKDKGLTVLYEYIDPFSSDISVNIPQWLLKRHAYIADNDDIFMAVTARKLFKDGLELRKNCFLSPNAVDYHHWAHNYSKPPAKILPIIQQGKPIIGYHGAMASWIDYELLSYINSTNDFSILLVGPNYDGSLKKSGILNCPNIHYIGPVSYSSLPEYAAFYDVAIIPFLCNEMTDAISPIKIFEYMACGHPIVSTDISECRAYASCRIAKSKKSFIDSLYEALRLKNDESFLQIVYNEAIQNSWRSRCKEIIDNCLNIV